MKKIALILASCTFVSFAYAKDITEAKKAVNQAISAIATNNLTETEKNVEIALDYVPDSMSGTKEYLERAKIKLGLTKDLFFRPNDPEREAVRKEIRQLLYNAWDSLRK